MCPWCCIGKRRMESALARLEHRDQVAVRWHSFELRPGHSRAPGETVGEMMRHHGMSPAQWATLSAQVTELAAAEGIQLNLGTARPVDSFDTHREVETGHGRGKVVRTVGPSL